LDGRAISAPQPAAAPPGRGASRRRWLERAAAAAALAGRAAVAVVGDADVRAGWVVLQQVAQMGPRQPAQVGMQAQHLVEVAVVQVPCQSTLSRLRHITVSRFSGR
jgi:hypothetical protein